MCVSISAEPLKFYRFDFLCPSFVLSQFFSSLSFVFFSLYYCIIIIIIIIIISIIIIMINVETLCTLLYSLYSLYDSLCGCRFVRWLVPSLPLHEASFYQRLWRFGVKRRQN